MKTSQRSQNFEGIYNPSEANCLDEWIPGTLEVVKAFKV